MTLRNQLFAVMDMAFSLPRVIVLALGAWAYWRGSVTLGQVTAAMLYMEMFYGPFDRLVMIIDHLQVGIASTTRLLGIAEVPPDRTAGSALPQGRDLVGRDLRYAYRDDHDVLHGIDLTLRTGERLAIVGPSGSGKSTLGRPSPGSTVLDRVSAGRRRRAARVAVVSCESRPETSRVKRPCVTTSNS